MRRGGKGKVQAAFSAYLISRRSLPETLHCWRALVEALRAGSYVECLQAISGLRTLLKLLEGAAPSGEQETLRTAFRDCRRQIAAFNASGDSRPLLEAAEHVATTLSRRLDRPEQALLPVAGKELRMHPRRAALPQAEARTRS